MKYGLVLIGFGGVNRTLVKLIRDKKAVLSEMIGLDLSVVAVSDVFYGMAHAPQGLDLESLITLPGEKGALASLPDGRLEADNEWAISQSGGNVVVEATFTNAETGEPAVSYCRQALSLGKHVVTTNKGPIALFGTELEELAGRNNASLGYEGTVMSGTPVLRVARETLKGCEIRGFWGILNGTTNFILGRVEQGGSMDDAIKEAQALGYAEADPAGDIHGHDVMLKVQILANMLMGANLSSDQIICEGITNLTSAKIQSALKKDSRWKLVGQASRNEDGSITASVTPRCLPNASPLASISGPVNAITFDTDLLGGVTISGAGAGRMETAFALLSDIIAIHKANI